MIKLDAGNYMLDSEYPNGSQLPLFESVEVTIAAGQYTEVIVTFDSGIR